jgi:hypothetical protein|tara:strand:- start:25 stop:171 length:147 start_codon:yes stop_codon:yes gene_type:complete
MGVEIYPLSQRRNIIMIEKIKNKCQHFVNEHKVETIAVLVILIIAIII